MYCDANGQPDPNGDFQLINGNVCIRDGRRVSFDLMFRDTASTAPRTFSDAKPADPASIDEVVGQALKNAAERAGSKDLAGWLAGLEPKEIDQIVTQAAVGFVRGHASGGIARHFATDAAMDAELTYRLAAARTKHEMAEAHKPLGARKRFTANDAAAVVAKAAAARITTTHQADAASAETERLRSEAAGARVARDYLTANAWRR